ncbi:His Kinase A (phospho-acceptor) domain-containing protein [Syntrophus gentianae]|uniref:histidine kinase n=1 Tax=Syntrophus gentianae TaxID=43775 RepID=A0A1H7UY10_9BACT|nr:ATP-binding protein [Syntrophus gentianae]SEM01851.1 His Kinase A (phospho-acceptor) domain-containing protein [Syntrophus gentianae]
MRDQVLAGLDIKQELIVLHRRISELEKRNARIRKVVDALRRSKRKLSVEKQIADIFLTCPDEEMYGEVLNVVLKVQESQYGVFGYIDEDGALVMPSLSRNAWQEDSVPEKSILFQREFWDNGLWEQALREKRSFYDNIPLLIPEGHVPIYRFLTVPILFHEEVIGLLSVANKEKDYTEEDRKIQETIAGHISPILHARLQRDRQEKERKRAEEEQKRLEECLHRAEKMEVLGTMAGGVAHDLNNILGVLVGYSELLLLKMPENSPYRNYISNILESGKKSAAIIQDLLTLTRRGVAVSEVLNLNKIVSDYLKTPEFDMLKSLHPGVTFRADLDPDLLNMNGSPVHLLKMVMNLVSNAAEASFAQGKVTISTENRYLESPVSGYDDVRAGEHLVLTVSDRGKGIAPEDIGRIFEPFYTKKVMGRSGTGLGLAVVWGAVKDHEGYIDVKSTEGKGSTFTLYFPVVREKEATEQQPVSLLQYQGKNESVLVVDDVEGQRQLASSILTMLGYQVTAVSSGEEAVEYLRKNRADLLVLDMIMTPGIDGLETYRRILEISPQQKAVIVSGFSETERVREVQRLGAGAYIRKPYLMEKIGLAIRRELDRK